MKNTHLAVVFDQLGMPTTAQQARDGRDMTKAVSSLVNYEGTNERVRGEAALVCSAAEKDGYDMVAHSAFMSAQWISMSYAKAAS